MPSRSILFPRAPRLQRLFHTSAARHNHYETLQVSPDATPAEVKKSFYSLSKTHHPDRNPDDPGASERFVAISDAYATLSTPAKRQEYDRTLDLHSSSPSSHSNGSHSHHRPHGSYHSSGPAGGRPASGLSRRRTQFRGPPPSFYRSGGWGEHSAKRKAAHDAYAETATAGEPGMGPGQKAWGHDEMNDVPHFDRESHYRTHERHSQRWQRRKGMEDRQVPAGEVPPSTLANFLFVGGIIVVGTLVPTFIFERMTRTGKNKR
ncbi:uncharacterized protein L3040_005568 [Drepanopeziza brunnea f. sp. 'multigermtubi']|uniref:DnaJ domain-containing protein n=1 Tax=Marssonina brunnea f. sp. multigermtubi (strain MB_m1) TaxID=1072389 RepID=K1XMW4_MARBU|nr:DnaJ domain-containing protein [Drepanopeziza brunnea f. sp. 'multigermtubi' MB_m1]EKD13814.1 DnaJ domain-containing protein [Drepanopeziza brunnea f. sp. 'multigermtubi' MB_m1]KAJ5041011.1 hypothetical protein L3040_005568 [Drepanopeziza brunnea f. sp. 'multigermtubi']